jgi:branched-subunit amino acid aminotransferase/4-amino-4-deoxychorismate lyase
MHVCSNFSIIDSSDFHVDLNDRSFNYGDGLFETMISKDGQIRWLDDHWERLQKGCKVLGFKLADGFSQTFVNTIVNELISKNQIQSQVRVKLKVWRISGGLYTPKKNETHFLIIVSPYQPTFKIIEHVDFSERVHLQYSIFSSLKTSSALPYVIAGLEKKERSLEEIILTDTRGNISECLSSNIFWFKNNTAYTPSLSTGCLEGIARKNLIRFLKDNQVDLAEGEFNKQELLLADTIITTNVAGVHYFKSLRGVHLKTKNTLVQKFIESTH